MMPSRFKTFMVEAAREGAAVRNVKRRRVELEKSLCEKLWTTSKALTEFKFWFNGWNGRINETCAAPWLGAYLQKHSWTRRRFIRFPIVVVFRLAMLGPGLIAAFVLFVIAAVVATVKLTPTYVKFRRMKSKELATFDRSINDETKALELKKQGEQVNERIKIEDQKRQEQEELVRHLTFFWIAVFRNSSTETLLDVWTLFQQFPVDHYIFAMLENSPGPVIRQIVDHEVALRQISDSARQLALLRLERKQADATKADLIERIASASEQSASERHTGIMNGLIAVAMLNLMK